MPKSSELHGKVEKEKRSSTTNTTPAPESKSSKKEDLHQRIRIKIRAFDHKIIDQSTKTIIDTAKRTGAEVMGPIPLPTGKEIFTVNRATFKYSRSKDQFEMRTHKRLIDIIDPNTQTVEALMSLSLPAGVDIEIKM